ncbi:MAG: hypothetical protein JST89_11795 [Cyanobacteria bacterium SZAS-4]|nr:hypothetical protein [Cyanobacteria bacterium SZAS-4]
MSTQAHRMLNKFRHVSQNSRPPVATSSVTYAANGTDPDAPPISAASGTHQNQLKYERPDLPPTELHPMFTNQSLEELLNGISNLLLPPLALADGGDAFDGDATNDWFYPGRSLRNGMLPDVDLVEIQVLEISQLS